MITRAVRLLPSDWSNYWVNGHLRPLSFGPTSPRTRYEYLLEPIQPSDPLSFGALVSSAGCEVLVFFCPSAGPLDQQAIDLVLLANPECYGEFGLGEITRSAFDQTRLNGSMVKDFHRRADRVTI